MAFGKFMQIKEINKAEIETKAATMSDFLRMEYLEECHKHIKSIDVKKFCHFELAKLYDARGMFSEAARNMKSVNDFALTFKEKMQNFVKEAEMWIKATQYDRADEAFKKALTCGNTRDKEEIKKSVKEFYKKQAAIFEKADRRANALKVYERLIEIADENEKPAIKEKLFSFYSKLGKIKEAMALQGQVQGQGR